MTIRLTRDFTAAGLSSAQLKALCGAGALARVRRGAYSEQTETEARAVHRQLITATWPLLSSNPVLSHGSAAALQNLPLWGSMLDRVSITRPSGGHGVRRRYLHVWLVPLEPSQITILDGFRVTILERTAFDVARGLDYERAVAVLDAALHGGARREVIEDIVKENPGRLGVRTARAALTFADGRAESVGESISRIRMSQVGIPAPELQFEVFDHNGVFLGRTDFAWPGAGVVGEFDGKVKYVGTPGDVATTVMNEKRREQAIRDLGWVLVRWGWADLSDPETFRDRILKALAHR